MRRMRELTGDSIEAMTPTVHTVAMLSFQFHGQWTTREVALIGIDEKTHSGVSDFGRYLAKFAQPEHLSFDLRETGYDVHDHQAGPESPPRTEMGGSGWPWRRARAEQERKWLELIENGRGPIRKQRRVRKRRPAQQPINPRHPPAHGIPGEGPALASPGDARPAPQDSIPKSAPQRRSTLSIRP